MMRRPACLRIAFPNRRAAMVAAVEGATFVASVIAGAVALLIAGFSLMAPGP